MDLVLNTDDELYGHLSNSSTVNNVYLLINELPKDLLVFNKSFTMVYHESVSDAFEDDVYLSEFNMMRLNKALKQTLQRYNSCFICFNGNTFCVISQGNAYCIFDSHSRDFNGHQVSEGRSLMKSATTWHDVHRYCSELAKSMNLLNDEQFEIMRVTVSKDVDSSCRLFAGEDVEDKQSMIETSGLVLSEHAETEIPNELVR